MAELNEEQLLLLDNMMYYEGSAKGRDIESIVNQMIEDAKAGKTELFSGGFESDMDKVEEIGNAILADPELCSLIRRDSINTEQVRASCFIDDSGDATIAIKGTGGTYEAWSDNFQGIYQADTTAQKQLAGFVEEQCSQYTDITITGHSKGGNMAQYATVLYGDHIDRCVSFDGQGFGDSFLRKYKDEIAANSGKIKSICAESDFVNILMFSIAGETVYLNTGKKENFFENHSSFLLWKENSGKMERGEFSETVEQSFIGKALDAIADSLVVSLDMTDPMTELCVVNLLGAVFATGLSGNLGQIVSLNPSNIMNGLLTFGKNIIWHIYDMTADEMNDHNLLLETVRSWILPGSWNFKECISYLENIITQNINNNRNNQNRNGSHTFSVDTKVFEYSLDSLIRCANQMEEIYGSLNTIHLEGELNFLYSVKLFSYKKSIENEMEKIRMLHGCLNEIFSVYFNTENSNINVM